MIRELIRVGDGPPGQRLMKFTLTYRGELRSNDDYRRKWAIRQQFHPQLQELWRVNPSLQNIVEKQRYIPQHGWWKVEQHHSLKPTAGAHMPFNPEGGYIDLCAPIVCGGRNFLPLVRDTFALQCGLKVMFLRKEEPGRVYQGGDLDNRLKTLFDALSVPNQDQILAEACPDADPIYCLLEDDRLITKVEVDTRRLLSEPGASQHEVHLFIDVDVHVSQSRAYNQVFLGD